MHRSIFLSSLWVSRKSTFFWSLALAVMALVTVALYGSMAEEYGKIVEAIPPEIAILVGDVTSASTPAGFLALELFGMVLPVSLAIIGIGSGAGMIGREEEHGTLELLLSSPLSRGRILLEKAGAIAMQVALVALAVWVAVAVGTLLFEFEISLASVAKALLSGWLLGVLFAYVALAIHAASGSRGLALGAGVGVLIVTYFSYSLTPMVKSIENAKYASPFYYYDGQAILMGDWEVSNLLILAGAAALLLATALLRFSRRDIGS